MRLSSVELKFFCRWYSSPRGPTRSVHTPRPYRAAPPSAFQALFTRMDEERFQDELRLFKDRNFLLQKLRSFFPVYLLLALSLLLTLILFGVSLSKVSSVSSELHKKQAELKKNHSSPDYQLFPCGPESREWRYFNGKCYYFSLQEMNWHKAKEQCKELHSQLVVINNLAEQNFLAYRMQGRERYWLGLTDVNMEGKWEWIDGTDYMNGFTFWKKGEPNDSGHREDCAHLWNFGEWNDVYCSYECHYICEKPVPA
ncbi:hepatic lectin-like isoform X3 [Alligator sinensis]|uniref:Hepatic lectin-like isoform X3 n=1 Tax=Alligator sinensis TaxID=38654 RepID=A0A3Q0GNK5_ALLSI|nr:hepatic lectin-like isoform X3 [Alligator sinensis]